jgi:hypothetical protein
MTLLSLVIGGFGYKTPPNMTNVRRDWSYARPSESRKGGQGRLAVQALRDGVTTGDGDRLEDATDVSEGLGI